MQDFIISALPGVAAALLTAGGLLVKVNRLEKDVDECVRREVYDLAQRGLKEHLERIERQNDRILDRLDENTNPRGTRIKT